MEPRAIWANRYAIFDEIASGGMATVFLGARLGQVNGRRVVAVKKLADDFAREPEFVAMFLDEARLAARVRHPNVIETFQVLRVPGSLAIVMELVVGASLLDLLRASRDRGLDPPPAVIGAIMAGALRGLHAAHEAKNETGEPFNLVHRDVSPHNLLVGQDGVARVIDFGVAKAAGRLHVTEVGMARGNASYMAPEQIRGKGVDRRTDVYAAGVVLWEIFAGRPLFPVSTDTGMLGKRAAGVVVASPPSSANPGVPAGVDALVMRALELDPARRFASAEEMAVAVEATLGAAPQVGVGRWVTDLAGPKLRELQGKVKDVEDAHDRGELDAEAPATRPDPQGWAAALVIDAPNLDIPATLPSGSVSAGRAVAGGDPKPRPPAVRAVRPVVDAQPTGTASLVGWAVLAILLLGVGVALAVTR